MNSALQCLSNTPSLTKFFLSCPDLVPRDIKPALGQAYGKLMVDIWQAEGRGHGYVAPTGVLHAIKQAWPAFRGFQQHDAQEFLRCCMDQFHKELMEPVVGEEMMGKSMARLKRENSGSEVEQGSEESSQYDTADSDSGKEGVMKNGNKRRKENVPDDRDSGLGSSHPDYSLSPFQSGSPASMSDAEYCDATSDGEGSHPPQDIRQHKVREYCSIITDIFDGALESSVQCLTCNTVSKTQETFQDLSLPIPSGEVREGQKQDTGWVSWAWGWLASWFYGPDVSLSDCLACFFSADELKGDNMYSCDKCKKLRNGLKYSQVTKLPDTLCIHLKRFRHDFAFSSKISTRVSFPLSGLDMSSWLHSSLSPKMTTTYSLSGVVCHHGTAGGGHYTSYCFHPPTNSWYEYDDSLVREVDRQTVINCEAYVLFYRKESSVMEKARVEVDRLNKLHRNLDSVVTSYISNMWLAKFYSMAEPGPVDNSSIICRHGGVLPSREEAVGRLVTAVPSQVWSYLHAQFGGSAAVTSLQVCNTCREEERAEIRQKEFELKEFKMLHEDKNQNSDRYCLSATWFRDWEAWVCNKAREPPGPINNKGLVVQRQQGHSLRPNMDHFKFSEDIWALFLALYGGGPEVVLPAEGGVRVATPRPQTMAHLRQRLRVRSLSQREERGEVAQDA
jgi:ubiquitin carboxyl-terminal hydrolase 20/33